MDWISMILIALGQMLYSFGGRPSGRYVDAAGTTYIDYHIFKVFVRLANRTGPMAVQVRFNQVIANVGGETLVFTFDSKQDRFTGPGGIELTKAK